jgi:glycosyltransferase involved in cell wall biosynthesis
MYVIKKVWNADLVHITGDIHYCAIFLPKSKIVLTVHDLSENVYESNIHSSFYRFFWYYLPLKRVDLVTCVSDKTKQDLNSYFPFVSEKIVVIPNPITIKTEYIPKIFNKKYPRFLLIGTAKNKNLKRAIEALSSVNCEVRIIGKISREVELQLMNLNLNYSLASDLTDSEMNFEYAICDALVFVSTFEGFGLPIIEAQSTGRVVVTSNIEPLKDTSGGSAIFVDPLNVHSIISGLKELINDDELRTRLIKNGIENVKRFDVEVISREYANVYSRLL